MPKTQPLIINGQSIPGSFYGMLVKRFGKHEARRILYRAREAKSIVRWIRKGITKAAEMYALNPCRDEYQNPHIVTGWIEENICNIKPEPKRQKSTEGVMINGKIQRKLPPGIGEILGDIL